MKIQLLAGPADYSAYDNGECLSGQQIYVTHGGKNIGWAKYLELGGNADTYK